MKSRKNFCILPWVHVATNTAGEIKPCCFFTRNFQKEDGSSYNFGWDSVMEALNSPDAVSIRKKMLDGETIPECAICTKAEESQNLETSRIFWNRHYESQAQAQQAVRTSQQNQLQIQPTDIRNLDIRLGNLCNLKCRSCDSKKSIQLYRETKQLMKNHPEMSDYYKEPLSDDHAKQELWIDSEITDQNIGSVSKNLDILHFAGGETTIIEKNYQILDSIISQGKSKDITVMLSVNLTRMPERLFDLLQKFKSTKLMISIDGQGEMFEYLRYPARWSQVESHFNQLLENYDLDFFRVIAMPVIQITNLSVIGNLFQYFERFNDERRKSAVLIRPIILENPSHLHVRNLPLRYKQECWSQIEDVLKNGVSYQTKSFFDIMKQLQHDCQTEAQNIVQLEKYLRFSEILDRHRNQSLAQVNPQLFELLQKTVSMGPKNEQVELK